MNGETLELNFASPVAASTPAAESIHTDGRSYFLSLPKRRLCRYCRQLLPLGDFESRGKEGKRRVCKSCYRPRKKAKKQRWLDKNRQRIRAYNRQYQAARKVPRTKPPPCPVCKTENFFWRRNEWHCRTCSNKRYDLTSNAKKKGAKVIKHAEKIRLLHGPAISDAYLRLHTEKPFTRMLVPVTRLIQLAITFQGRSLTQANAERIWQLNRLAHKPTDNLGWDCSKCGLHSPDFRFFDVDHITPRSKHGHGRRDNLQILCPNCHRSKTIADLFPSPASLTTPPLTIDGTV